MSNPGLSNPGSIVRWTRREFVRTGLAASAAVTLGSTAAALGKPGGGIDVSGAESLRSHAQARGLLYGAAVATELLDVDGAAAGKTADPYTQLVLSQANIVVAENAMKWGPLRPTAATFDFTQADRLMRFAQIAQQKVRGHNLCWHESLPAWFATTATKDNARQLLVNHIQTVAGRYKGQMHSWDVVNEAVLPKDGRADALRKTPWLELAGPDYIELAFQTAAAADPASKLTYNEYDIELDTPEQSEKRAQVLLLVRRLKARSVPIHAVGIQSHLQADGPRAGAGLTTFIRELKKLDLEVYVTELDVNSRGIEGGAPVQDEAVAKVYEQYLGLVLPEPNVAAVLTWGITDAHTWMNTSKAEWVVRKDGARQRPLPFDDDMAPTPAFEAVRTAMDEGRAVVQPLVSRMPGEIDPSSLYQPFTVPGSPGTTAGPAKSIATPRMQH
jgi:endo-1,4-beta-xylanase